MTPDELVKYVKSNLVKAGYGDSHVRAGYVVGSDGIEISINSKNNVRYMAHRLDSPVTLKGLKSPIPNYIKRHVIENIEKDIQAGHTDWISSGESQK